jgi:hypothetical protein
MGHGTRCLSAVVASVFVAGAVLRATRPIAEAPHDRFPHEPVALTTSQNLLATDPYAIVQRIYRFNRERFGTAHNESNYPPLAQRQVFARAMAARSAEAIAEVPVELELRVIAHATLDATELDRTRETLRQLLASGGVLSRWRDCSGAACSEDPAAVAIDVLLLPVTKLTEGEVHGEVTRDATTGVATVLIYVPPIAERVRAIRTSLDGRSNPALATIQTGHLVGAAMAHEVGHALGLPHGARGVMKGQYTLDEALALRTSRLVFTSAESASMRSVLRTARNSAAAAR